MAVLLDILHIEMFHIAESPEIRFNKHEVGAMLRVLIWMAVWIGVATGCKQVPVQGLAPDARHQRYVDQAFLTGYAGDTLFLNSDDLDSDMDGIENVADSYDDFAHCPD